MKPPATGAHGWLKHLAWLVALWVAGVGVVGVAAWVLKGVMRAVGLAQ